MSYKWSVNNSPGAGYNDVLYYYDSTANVCHWHGVNSFDVAYRHVLHYESHVRSKVIVGSWFGFIVGQIGHFENILSYLF